MATAQRFAVVTTSVVESTCKLWVSHSLTGEDVVATSKMGRRRDSKNGMPLPLRERCRYRVTLKLLLWLQL